MFQSRDMVSAEKSDPEHREGSVTYSACRRGLLEHKTIVCPGSAASLMQVSEYAESAISGF